MHEELNHRHWVGRFRRGWLRLRSAKICGQLECLQPQYRPMVWGLCGIMCLVAAGPALGAENRFDGVYTGKATLTKGSSPGCPADDDISVTVHGKTLKYTGSRLQNFVIAFYPRQDGSFRQSHVHQQGAFVNIEGRVSGELIEADVANPHCEHHWYLRKEAPAR